MIRDRVRDEAIAIAKAYSHPTVELRHVLWGLVYVLGPAAPPEVPLATAKSYLDPAGTVVRHADRVRGGRDRARHDHGRGVGEGRGASTSAPGSDRVARTRHHPRPTPRRRRRPRRRWRGGHGSEHGRGERGHDRRRPPRNRRTARRRATPAPKETTESILAELDALIGLVPVKAAVRSLIAVQMLNTERREAGLPEVNASLHIVFTGNPGTGKTTIARIIGRLYGSLGLVSKGQVIEVSRADLVAGYVGQTALKVQAAVDRAVGGVLFIDEAYSLSMEGSGEFGAEAVAELVKLMEDHRDDLAVIAAGYPEEMKRFIDSNPGLRSRFTHYIDFPDYTPAELVQVFEGFATVAKVNLGEGVTERLGHLFLSRPRSATSATPATRGRCSSSPTRTWRRARWPTGRSRSTRSIELRVEDLPEPETVEHLEPEDRVPTQVTAS